MTAHCMKLRLSKLLTPDADAGRRKYSEALQLFVQGLTVPSYAVNAITIATYKKYALVSLIHNGEQFCIFLHAARPLTEDPAFMLFHQNELCGCMSSTHLCQLAGHVAPLPKFTPSAVTRSIKSDAQAYTDLATAYSSKKLQDLPALVEKHQALFSEVSNLVTSWSTVTCAAEDCMAATRVVLISVQDGNMGLVNLVLAAKTKRAIQKLTQTFLTLSLADIAQQVGLESAAEAEGHILRFTGIFVSSGSALCTFVVS